MVIYVEYNIPKDYFLANKKKFQKLLHTQAFRIAVMKFEHGMTYQEIAKRNNVTIIQVRKTISFVCERLRDKGFEV